jgi:hypothetical protein
MQCCRQGAFSRQKTLLMQGDGATKAARLAAL